MAYRIHFTVQDLARTHVAEVPIPLFELDLAARALQDRSQPALLDPWRRRARTRLPADTRIPLALIPPTGWSFMLSSRTGTPEEVLEQVRAMPRRQLDARLAGLAELRPIPSWVRWMSDDPAFYQRFVDGFGQLYDVLLGPYEAQLTDVFTADRAVRMRQLLRGGVEGLLAQANPRWMRWNPPVLEIRMANNIDYDLHLQGQGLLLVPSMFGTRSVVIDDSRPRPIVAYPAGQDQPLRRFTTLVSEQAGSMSAISALLGRTRAAVLDVIAEHPGCSTKELAAFAGIAPASASEHATVLRQAGLINTTRHRNAAVHTPTDLGIALLDSAGRRRENGPPADRLAGR